MAADHANNATPVDTGAVMPIATATRRVALGTLMPLITGIAWTTLITRPAFSSLPRDLPLARTLIKFRVSIAVTRVRNNRRRPRHEGEAGNRSNQRARFEHGVSH